MPTSTPPSADPQPVSTLRSDRVRWALLIAWIVVMIGITNTGSRAADWQRLVAAVESGEVTQVHVASDWGGPLSGVPHGPFTGGGQVAITWQDGPWPWQRHFTGVYQATQEEMEGILAWSGDIWVAPDSPVKELRTRQPDLEVTYGPRARMWGEVYGWRVSTWWSMAFFAVGVGALFLLVLAPRQPWRATRWAWFWISSNPLGALAFLALSGPTPGVPAAHEGHQRLTGGWVFLMMMVVNGMTVSWMR